MNRYKYHTAVEIRFSDIDSLGHVNNAVYLTYMENARFRFFEETFGRAINWETEGLIVARAEVNYVKPVYLKDTLVVYTGITRIGRSSFDIGYTLVVKREGKEVEVANGTTVLVCYSYADQRSIPIPDHWLPKLNMFEGVLAE
ncbi:MAG: acyl-CoA thioesterase [Flavobacteriales bacterium]|nr:acyl-CoA thioesterase [Flavobacteriales bacterium]MCB9447943.1 acyl-CoA thioesterase [Flavobacteriales bacterium]